MLMNLPKVMFGGIIGKIFNAGLVVKLEILLGHLVKQPKILHFHCTRSLSLNRVIHDAYGGSIVAMDWRLRLWVAQFL